MQKGSGFRWSGSVRLSSTPQRMQVAPCGASPTQCTARAVAADAAATHIGACASSCRPEHAVGRIQASWAVRWALPLPRHYSTNKCTRYTTAAEAPERHSLSHALVRCLATAGTRQQQVAATDTAASMPAGPHSRGPAPASVGPCAAAAAAPAASQPLTAAATGSTGQSCAWTSSSAGLLGSVQAGPWRHAVPLPPAPVVSVWWAPLDQASSCRPELLPRLCSCLPPEELRELSGQPAGPRRSAVDTVAGSGPKLRVGGEDLRTGGRGAVCGGSSEAGERGQQQGEEDEVRAKRVAARALARAVLARALGRAEGQGAGGGGVAALEGDVWVNGSTGIGVPSSDSTSTSTSGGSGGPCGEPPRPQELRFVRNSHGKPLLVGLEPRVEETAAAAAAAWGAPAAPSGEHAGSSSRPRPNAPLSHLGCSSALGSAGAGPLPVVLHHNLTHTHDLAGVAVVRPAVAHHHQQHTNTAGAATACAAASLPTGAAAGPGGVGPCVLGVGLDVERADRAPRNPLALARRRLAAREAAMVAGAAGPDQARTFMWLWALKEAFVKARGTGISAAPGLKGFTIGLQPMAAPAVQRLAAAHPGCRVAPGVQRISLELDPAMVRRRGPGQQQHQAQGQRQQQQALEHPQPAAASGLGAASAEDAVHPGTRFSMLLFQPTPGHVAALCIATWDAELGGEEGGQGPTESGWVQAWESGVEHWWCLPLEAEGLVTGGQVVILAAT